MASQQERGGIAFSDEADPIAIPTTTTPSSSSPRHVRYPPPTYCDIPSATSSTIHSLTSASTIESKLDLSPTDSAARKGLLRDSFFDNWRDDGSTAVLGSPEEMQRKDPLATQIWKLYSKTKTQLPNAERMENLTWRMMSMNLRRKERERLRQEESVSGRSIVSLPLCSLSAPDLPASPHRQRRVRWTRGPTHQAESLGCASRLTRPQAMPLILI